MSDDISSNAKKLTRRVAQIAEKFGYKLEPLSHDDVEELQARIESKLRDLRKRS